MNWRRNFWRWVRRSVDEGALLPRWAIVVRWILFPMDSAYWHLASTRGYNPLRDTWLIDGMEFTGAAMHALVNSHGEVFRITRTGQTVTLERVQTAQPGGGCDSTRLEYVINQMPLSEINTWLGTNLEWFGDKAPTLAQIRDAIDSAMPAAPSAKGVAK